jgi:hypothetical protein
VDVGDDRTGRRQRGLTLDPERIVETVARLQARIHERFPEAGLGRICRQLLAVAEDARARTEAIARPIIPLRAGIAVLILLIVIGLVAAVVNLPPSEKGFGLVQFVQLVESAINDLVFVGAAIVFLITVEARVKRSRALRSLHELRSIAHIIDMHQLTKDPERVLLPGRPAAEARGATMTSFELHRYLDYCSEMLSLTGKVAALYVRHFDDPVALAAVNEIESLTTGLARKIWQKISLLGPVRLA